MYSVTMHVTWVCSFNWDFCTLHWRLDLHYYGSHYTI